MNYELQFTLAGSVSILLISSLYLEDNIDSNYGIYWEKHFYIMLFCDKYTCNKHFKNVILNS
jgi:hypothetical protein